ncbi:beta-propeller fold lactonase family protein [bacterium]|nr:beta-propeller fold lactonase family protein [bacterium]
MLTHIRMLCLAGVGLFIFSCSSKIHLPGPVKGGVLLPNRWLLSPVGAQLALGDLPLNMALSPSGDLLAVNNNGFSRHFITIIDPKQDQIIQELDFSKGFYGMAFAPDGRDLYASGGADDKILHWRLAGDRLETAEPISLEKTDARKLFPAGLAVSRDGRTLYVAENKNDSVALVDLQKADLIDRIAVGSFPYDVRVAERMGKAFVSLWGESRVAVIDLEKRTVLGRIAVGDHPNAMLLTADQRRLYVACANTDQVSVIDVPTDRVVEQISLRPYDLAPFGSTPNGLALSVDERTLFVANATNNDVAVIELAATGSRVAGVIPAGWYPTAICVHHNKLYVANGKGITSKANPHAPGPYGGRNGNEGYIGGLFNGMLSIIPIPDARQLDAYTRMVYRNNGFVETQKRLAEEKNAVAAQPVPRRRGEPSLIKHVIYIIKENRTYDQVFGDLPQGNGDPELCIFGRAITPNHHALAETFVLLDNFFVDAEVSADGHEWSTGAIATDFVEKTWPTSYSGRGLPYPAEGSFSIAFPTNGYIWEAVAAAGLTYRSYGEFVDISGDSLTARHPALVGHFAPHFRSWDLDYPDTLRAAAFIAELREFEAQGEMPQFIILRLPNDHTIGAMPGKSSPRAMVADNDLALGRVVEAVTRSRFWPTTAIFVLEDDAQNGPDHVDAHRSPALLVSPYVRRGEVDHTLYDTVSMLATMEMILGLKPLSQYDAAAFPMVTCFTDTPDFTSYTALRPKVSMAERNTVTSWGSRESLLMNFNREDATPELELNEIVWRSIKGEDSVMPRPIHRRSLESEPESDEE